MTAPARKKPSALSNQLMRLIIQLDKDRGDTELAIKDQKLYDEANRDTTDLDRSSM